jgi:hypothetical protein
MLLVTEDGPEFRIASDRVCLAPNLREELRDFCQTRVHLVGRLALGPERVKGVRHRYLPG